MFATIAAVAGAVCAPNLPAFEGYVPVLVFEDSEGIAYRSVLQNAEGKLVVLGWNKEDWQVCVLGSSAGAA